MQITIVTPAFNCAHTINDVYENLKPLLASGVRWIIVNDCSTDNTKELLEYISKSEINVSVFELHKNSGPNIARRFGVSKSSSDLVYLLDSDDFIYTDVFQNFIEFVTSNIKFDYFYAPLKVVDNKIKFNNFESFTPVQVREINKPTDLIRYGFPQPSAILIKKDFYLANDVSNTLKWGEDFFTFLCLSSNGKGIRWTTPISCYVIGGGRGSVLSLKLRMALSKTLFMYSVRNENNKFNALLYTGYLTLRHIASYAVKKLKKYRTDTREY
ncbi:glycosyltransferase family 2 protein [Serratia marcescens]|uniref:glycosyltransferase family 2 protein n=1 Tax=Serratia marcescens TaxID=615 RepID=UPI0027473B06|nr:glycosyltransferase family 2 protein [Serratia marcescens]MDP8772043.1 glycosyltransferase family 2 protein [Serratia marcescens]MDP8802447.1 glycosyltransferase family 2 protein [Serratia marcescens]MDP8872298.1 glycosyltransferase family 2 protein [Serratia marcescens]